jgi:predicted alpha-1,6-mannanase (GH76 family)
MGAASLPWLTHLRHLYCHVTGVNVTMQLPGTNPMEAMEIAEVVRELVTEFKVSHPDLTLHLSGMVMMNNAFGEAAMKDNDIV